MSKKTTGTLYRRSDTGKITTKEYADSHPKTTEKETFKKGK